MNAFCVVFERLARARRAWYERRPERRVRLGCPVVSVGNLSVGGSGKTPLVASVARLLRNLGYRPAVLSRGYARRVQADGVVVVSDGRSVLATAAQAGDEPFMLARALDGVAVLASPDRALAGHVAIRALGSTALVLDDGFQHLRMARDVDLLVVRPQDLVDRLLPAGRLREPLDAARRADAVLVPGAVEEANRVSGALGTVRVFHLSPRYEALRWVDGFGPEDGSKPPACCRRVLAVAGIARPERFVAALGELKWHVVREVIFPDHYWYRPRDIARVARYAEEARAELVVTTEKDAARLAALAARPWGGRGWTPWAVLPLHVDIEPADVFRTWLAAHLDQACV